jgi:Threonine dehydrogenase and related Zn-dependent dehydrogenases
MKAIVMEGPRKSRVVEVAEPKINDDKLLVKVKYTGMCHSEWYPWTVATKGTRFGHEPMGTVVEVGRNVKGFKKGDRVAGLGGGYCEYIALDPKTTIHIPDNISDEDGVVEPLSCLFSAASKLPITVPGDPIAIVGAGYMGLGIISLFKLKGAGKIVAVDPRKEARENALKFGATEVYAPEELPEDYILNWGNISDDLTEAEKQVDIFNTGFKTVMEFTGTEKGLRLAGDMVSAHGLLGIGGYHNDADRTIDFKLWNMKSFTAINCHERRLDFHIKCCRNAFELLSTGKWNFKGVNNRIYSMEEFDRANDDMDSKPKGYIKALIRCSD